MRAITILIAVLALAGCGVPEDQAGKAPLNSTAGASPGAGLPAAILAPALFVCPAESAKPGALYPGPDGIEGVVPGAVFPDVTIGSALNSFANPRPLNSTLTPSTTAFALHDLYCSGFRYAFITVAALWCDHSDDLNSELDSAAPAWWSKGGIVLEVVEEAGLAEPARVGDITSAGSPSFISLAIDPEQTMMALTNIDAWPGSFIVDLATMQVLCVQIGNYQGADLYTLQNEFAGLVDN
jgi:hypothetical protein